MRTPPKYNRPHANLTATLAQKKRTLKKLDDGWPESVEEQSLPLLVWRHYIARQYIKDVL